MIPSGKFCSRQPKNSKTTHYASELSVLGGRFGGGGGGGGNRLMPVRNSSKFMYCSLSGTDEINKK